MSDQTMFNSDQEQQQSNSDNQSLFTVGDRQYTAESAAKKIEHADTFIAQLQQEKRDLELQFTKAQTQLEQSTKLDDAISMFNQQQTEQMQQQQDPLQNNDNTSQFDPDAWKAEMQKQAREEAARVYQEQQQQTWQADNFNQSVSKVKNAYGDSFQDKLVSRGKELGLDQAGIDNLARTNPTMFEELFVPKPSVGDPSPNTQYSNGHTEPQPEINDILPDFSKHWDSDSRVKALREAEAQLNKINQ